MASRRETVAYKNGSGALARPVPRWELIFNPKDHELPNEVVDVEAFRLSRDRLEELGI